jgi:tRNA(fMet)-specific endonuclease VapC
MYALDTNSLVYFFKGMGGIAERLLRVPRREVGIPMISIYELEVGLAQSSAPRKRREQLSEFLTWAEILPFGLAEARAAAQLRAQLESAGTPIGPLDTLIAGTALSVGATLVTHNTREFGRVTGLTIEDWY